MLGSASAFAPRPSNRAFSRVQAADPWFPDAVSTVIPTGNVQTEAFRESFLEASPYTDQSSVPVNTYKAKVS